MDKYLVRKECGKSTTPVQAKKSKEGFQYEERQGDLFSCGRDQSLAHCISADAKMGKGIATIFKKKFGGVNEILQQDQKPGGLAVLKRDDRFIYYLVTKEKYWQKPTYETLESSLKAMKRHCLANNVSKVAMPKIGCGLDGLQWHRVQRLLRTVLEDTEIHITIYIL